MAENFYTILTNTGKAKLANAQALGTTVNFTHMGVGDSNGSYYNPAEDQAILVNEVWRGLINSINVDDTNPNWIVIEAVIPTTDGGFMVREVGIFDDAGDMIAVGKYPETYKPVTTEGSAKDLYIRMILEVSNSASVTLTIDPAIVLATKKNVEDAEKSAKSFASGLIGSLADLLTIAKSNIVAAINELKTDHDEHLADYAHQYAADNGSTDAYAITLDPAPVAYITGQHFWFKANTANTGACSLNCNSLGAKNIKKWSTTVKENLLDNEIIAGQIIEVIYDGTDFILLSRTNSKGIVYLYTTGTENVAWEVGYSIGTGSQSKETSNLLMSASCSDGIASTRIYVTTNTVDLTNISTLYTEVEATAGSGGTNAAFALGVGIGKTDNGFSASVAKNTPPFAKQIINVDVSALNGNYYLKLQANANTTNGNNLTVKIYRVWGE